MKSLEEMNPTSMSRPISIALRYFAHTFNVNIDKSLSPIETMEIIHWIPEKAEKARYDESEELTGDMFEAEGPDTMSGERLLRRYDHTGYSPITSIDHTTPV